MEEKDFFNLIFEIYHDVTTKGKKNYWQDLMTFNEVMDKGYKYWLEHYGKESS